jgi:hypothetical protein
MNQKDSWPSERIAFEVDSDHSLEQHIPECEKKENDDLTQGQTENHQTGRTPQLLTLVSTHQGAHFKNENALREMG